ncbi:kinase-like domain-containing protein [Rhizophagus irregularis DAOM 181602=DAOM 197198]|nr:kinase-like domain-containing protein [Rhizophagus irregularis DAOM 181602=DAOM 197198]
MFSQKILLTENNIQEYLEINRASENKKIDDFIQERQLKINDSDNMIVFEWIPYNQFNEIKETGKNGLITIYSAIWEDVALKCLHNSQSIDSLINEAKRYSTKYNAFQVLYGISKNSDTGNYILVQNNYMWTIFEWIPYNQFNEIKETSKNDLITIYSAIWEDGPLHKEYLYDYKSDSEYNEYTRDSNKKVALKCLHNSQSIDSLINEAKKYSTKYGVFQVLYGISQNQSTGDYILVQSYTINMTNWISGNKNIDDFIQEMQLKINNCDNIVFEWIPYNQFNEIKEIGKNGQITVYSAIWKDGPLSNSRSWEGIYTRDSYKEVALKCLHNLQSIDSLINEAKKYLTKDENFQILYGISQNPITGDYILVQNNCIWISENEKVDNFIQEMQLKINKYNDIVFEWIPYNQFNEIKETGKNGQITVYSAIWKDGPLSNSRSWDGIYTRDSYKEVALKCLHNLQSIDSLINEAKKYLTKDENFQTLYGISQNQDTGDYILVQNNYIWTSKNEKIDNFIKEMQLKINKYNDIVFEWIPYNQFNEIKETGKNGQITIYSAIWKDGPLHYQYSEYIRDSNKKVALKCLHNLQSIDSLKNEAKKYLKFQILYGISQNPDTRDYILAQNNYIWTSENEKVDNFIQEMQLKINKYNNIVFEWIPYNQFNEIKETGKNGLITVYSAIWKDGPLVANYKETNYTRDSNKKVALKCLHNLQSIDSLINEVKKYLTKDEKFQILYGISQNPDTQDYIFVQNNYILTMLEWIPYNQFNEIIETGKNGLITLYSAIWKDGPLHKKHQDDKNYTRDSNKKVALKCLHNSQKSIDSLINEVKKYLTDNGLFQVLYGISQNQDTGDYILVQNYTINMANWISGNEKIDDFIQEMQLKINDCDDIVLEWIPYNQFNEIKETGKNGQITVYSAIWKDGPLYKKYCHSSYIRDSNKKVALKCLHNSQESIDSLINKAKKYSTKNKVFQLLYGISQNSDTGDYVFVQNYTINMANWISGNEKIDDFIQEMQLKINDCDDIVFEWIPYNQFNEIKKTGKNGLITMYSAIWKVGPLQYNSIYSEYTRDSNKKVALKCLHNLQESIDSLINEAKKYSTKHEVFQLLYGISQNSDTGDYVFVQSYTINMANWISGNEKIDEFIQEMQLKINDYDDIVFEWIQYYQFNEIKEIGKNDLITIYSAIWKDGPLHKKHQECKYARDSNEKVALKYLHNSQAIDSLKNEAKKYSTKYGAFQVLYGISQNQSTGDYILVQSYTINMTNRISGNEKIDDFIQEMQLKINKCNDIVFEWIPYNQFNEIKETSKNGIITIYSAIWEDGPLHYQYSEYIRDSNKKVALKCLHNSQSIDSLINEVKKYSTEYDAFQVLYGISQNSDTGDYVFVQNYTINMENLICGNEKIDNFIQEMQLKIIKYNDIVFEWVPYNRFDEIKETGKNSQITIYSAIWKDGPLLHRQSSLGETNYTRDSNKKVALKCLHNLQSIDSLINEAKKYLTKDEKFRILYGMSQNPDTGDYIFIQNNYTWTSENENVDNFIKEMQLNNIVFEWILYNQFNEIKETGKNGLMTIYSAIWKDGPLLQQYSECSNEYTEDSMYSEYTRDSNKKVALKYLYNSQSINSLINEAKKYLRKDEKFQILYGISQNPDTGDYILVQNNYILTSGNDKVDNFIQEMQLKINEYNNIVFEWIPYNQFNEIKETGKNGQITIYSAIWKDGPLHKKHQDDKNYTRDLNEKVILRCLHNFQSIDSLINKAKKYLIKDENFQILFGISQNPDTGDYILVQNNYIWISGIKKVDNFIKEMQLKKLNINKYDNIVFEWIPYDQFNVIKETGKNGLITIYSAIWKDGPLHKKHKDDKNYTRDSNKKVALKYLHNSQSIDSLINEAKKYLTKDENFQILYGISQSQDTGDYILVQNNYIWISGIEKVDNFIQEMQLKINDCDDIVFEWIPYNQFNEIKETGKNNLITIYFAIWKDGPLHYQNSEYTRDSNKKVALKYLHNSQSIDSLINEAKRYLTDNGLFQVLYGISQKQDTGDYILVQSYTINMANWISGNEKIDNFIQEMQLKINDCDDIVIEWIPYNQFNEIKETGKNGLITIYSAIWKDGPLHYQYNEYTRNSNKKVALKCLHNLQESIDSLITEAKKYLTRHKAFQVLYGISQNQDTGDYILGQSYTINLTNWISGNEKIDNFIQKRKLKINEYDDIVLEWIPYNQFNEIKETGKNGLITVYSAIWKDGPLYKKNKWSDCTRDSYKEVALKYLHNSQSIDSLINEAKKYLIKDVEIKKIDDFIQEMQLKINKYNGIVLEWIPYNQFNEIKETGKNGLITLYSAIWKDGPLHKKHKDDKNYTRDSNKKVALKYLHNSQESIDSLINEARKYLTDNGLFQVLYGISQNQNTGDYILVQSYTINLTNWISGNEIIDDFIQEMQLKINKYNDIVFEWIPYNQFNEIKDSSKNGLVTIYSAIWKDGPFNYQNSEYTRDSNKKVALKYLHNLQSIDSLINEAKKYSTKYDAFQVLYGISLNQSTGDYILVQSHTKNLTNWISGSKKIDDFIQKINAHYKIVLEWIPYNQFYKIKKTGKNGVYSAIWKDGPLYDQYERYSNEEVAFKCLESINSLINEAEKYPIKHNVFQELYGISQNPDTEDYILVLMWTSGNEKIDEFIQEMQLQIYNYHSDIVLEWIPYNQFNEIKETGKNGLITIYSAIWKDGPLLKYDSEYSEYTRDSNKKVALKYLNNSQSIDSLINEAKKYSTVYDAIQALYGISQNNDTGDYILVQSYTINMVNWISGNEKIDNFIQEMQLQIYNYHSDIVFEWIPYNQFNEIKETGKNGLITIYSAIWKDGPLHYQYREFTRDSYKKVALKCLHNSQESIDSLINEAKKYSTKHEAFQLLYGISQNSDTGDYVFVQSYTINLINWISGNERIDNFIQERQLKINDYDDIILEWIPYNQFNEIEETGKNDLITSYLAIWKDGPLHKKHQDDKYYTRDSNKKVALKYLHNSQESIDSLINEAKIYPTKHKAFQVLYGISQNSYTGDYILVLMWTSGNKKIDDFIQEMQLKVNKCDDIVVEWIPYNQFNNFKKVGEGGFATVYSANWKNGPLKYGTDKNIYKRKPNKIVALKCLHKSQNISNKFLNEVKKYSINIESNILNIYGISQHPDTKEYVMVLQYAAEGNFNHWINENYEYFNWKDKLLALLNIINGLKEIHQKSILFLSKMHNFEDWILISDMGLCGKVGDIDIDETKIYGVMPYVAPEVLRRRPYTQESDIYSFGMIMYFVATGKQPFYNRAHDHLLALDICKGVRPEINEPEAPKWYIDLMKKCWDLNPNNRPDIFGINKLIESLHKSYMVDFSTENEEIGMQFKKAEEYRKANLSSIKNYQVVTHPQAIYTSRLLNPFTDDLPEYDDNSQGLDYAI